MIRIDNYSYWDTCLYLEQGALCLVIVPQAGGRTLSMRYRNTEFCRQSQARYDNDRNQSAEVWPNWGGDFDWVGPQESWSPAGWPPPYELDGAPWKVLSYDDHSVTLESQPCSLGVSLKKTITIGNDCYTVKRTMKNCIGQNIHLGIWNVTQVPLTGIITVPAATGQQVKVFPFPESGTIDDFQAKGLMKTTNTGGQTAISFDEKRGHFKVGLVAEPAVIRYQQNGLVMEKAVPGAVGGAYPHGCNIEIYRDEAAGYTELEQLGAMVGLRTGEECRLDQHVKFYKE